MQMIGTLRPAISFRLYAMASLCPRSSDCFPESAPFVSIKLIIGRLNFSACFICLIAFRYLPGGAFQNSGKYLPLYLFPVDDLQWLQAFRCTWQYQLQSPDHRHNIYLRETL